MTQAAHRAFEISPADVHNRTLVARVHPPDWVNPRPAGRYNLVVIGGGTAGLVSAVGAAGLGAKVALIERQLLGGDCLNQGCVPSKALIRAARAAHDARNAGAFGAVVPGDVLVDFARVMERMRELRAQIAHHDAAARLAEAGVDVFLGDAEFVSADEVRVAGEQLRFKRAVIATGTRAKTLPVSGLAEAGFLTNESVFSLTSLPKRLAVLGAGPIGCELAQTFRRFGSAVTLLDRSARVLPRDDAQAAALLERQLAREGVDLVLGAEPTEVKSTAEGKTIAFERTGDREQVVVDEILVAVGRVPNVDGLGLQAAGVLFDEEGVKVDDHLRTNNRRIFAAGDICSPYKFTHAADAMARLALQNALFMGRKKASALVIPWTTYADPEIAQVGLQAEEAKSRGEHVQTFTILLNELDRAILDGESEGFARIHIDARTGRILGATLVARHAGEMIGEVVLAMHEGLSIGALAKTVLPYPTQAEVWKKLGDAHARTRLTPWIRRVLAHYFRWRR